MGRWFESSIGSMSTKGKKRPAKWTFTVLDTAGNLLTTFRSEIVPSTYKSHFTVRKGNTWKYYVFDSKASQIFEKKLVYKEAG